MNEKETNNKIVRNQEENEEDLEQENLLKIENLGKQRILVKAEKQKKKFLIKLWDLFHSRRQFATLIKVYGHKKLCEDAKELITTIENKEDENWKENYIITKSKILKDKLELIGINENELRLIK